MTDMADSFDTDFETTALHLDGQTGSPRQVEVFLDSAARALRGKGIDWPLDRIRVPPDFAGSDLIVLRLADDPLQRLILKEPGLVLHLPRPHKTAPAANRGAILKWAAAAIASVALIVFVLVPVMADQLARFIPPEGERALGEATLTQIREAMDETGYRPVAFCDAPAGRAALDRLQARLETAVDLPTELTVHVLDHDMVNAFALPGGHIVFFKGLIDTADQPDELAAVFAHEIGHVVSRDPTRHALRTAGSIGVLGLLLGDFAGGTLVLFLAERLIDAQYSQGAEAKADLFAHRVMLEAGLPPDALARMFERFGEQGSEAAGIMAHFLSHPALGDRIKAARAATPRGHGFAPLLASDDWHALKSICEQKRWQ
ncbi:M48 family metallopeptidase [Tropicibacter oceani]|uniref:M48 family metallopeptidase n=1 Tax=Tropicibacter oceani TaxID=3058420 RepID=A0ABY8QKX5_9RHOB|nr:M48 family metallopeptidase [Tropicibacter oceani]WGW05184.1 M48 family metallopeptidase [Tropicibacter oceani]